LLGFLIPRAKIY